MSFWDLFKRKSSSEVAKERLMMILTYERKGLPPNFPERLKNDLISVFKKYPQFDAEKIEVEIKEENKLEELWISIPFIKGRFNND